MKSLFLFLLSLTVFAAPPSDLKFNVKSESGVYTLTPPKDHHFNINAPKFYISKGVKKNITEGTEKQLTFKNKAEENTLSITAYLCDDANTYCVKSETNKNTDSPKKKINVNRYLDKNGFIVNDQEKAFALAKSQNKPLLIDFFAIWCPPCNQLDETVFNSEEFKNKTKKFILLKMDVDHENSWELKSRYKIGGYPTVVFANSDGDEIFRAVGYFSKDEFLKKSEAAYEMRNESYLVLAKKADKDAVAAEKAGLIALERRDYEAAKKYLETALMKNPTKESLKVAYRKAELEILSGGFKKDQTKLNELIDLLEKDVKEFSSYAENETALFVMDSKVRLGDLYEKAKNEVKRKEVLTQASNLAEELRKKVNVKTKQLTGTDLTATDLKEQYLEIQEKLGTESVKLKKDFSELVDLYSADIKGNVNSRGLSLGYAAALWNAGFVNKAEEVYEKFEKQYPREFTFYYAHGRMYQELKQHDKAKPKLTKALEFSYGDNKLRATEALAKTEIVLGNKKHAQELVKKALDETQRPTDESVRTTRYLDSLKRLQDSLSKE